MTHRELIAKMTLAEKCALLSGKDVWHTRPVTRLSIPSITLSDGPSGLRKQAAEGDHQSYQHPICCHHCQQLEP